jgi:hypothetical protein
MRKIFFLSTFALLAISSTQAQIKQDPERSKIKRTAPTPPPPPAPVNKTTNAESGPAPQYNLTAVRVKIRTGSDNKEFPSKVSARLIRRNPASNESNAFSLWDLTNEMKINSDTEFGLDRTGSQYQFETKLDAFQSSGVKLVVHYVPNFFADAWKIENVTLMLEFRDQFGNLHPALGSKTVVFSNAYGFLNSEYTLIECITDGNFAPLTATIKKMTYK